jgi:F-type H+-transporting ATPase subunit a
MASSLPTAIHLSVHSHLVAIPNIPVGDHIKRASFNVDTIYATILVGAFLIGLGFYTVRRVSSGVPGKLQLFWETILGWAQEQVDNNLGPRYRYVVSLAATIFLMVLFANWVEILPFIWHSTDFLPSPSADINFCGALAILVFILTNAAGIKALGFRGWGSNIVGHPRALAPFHLIEEVVRPVTLALRLFGNIFAGSIMIMLLLAFPIYFFPVSVPFTIIWKLFDMFIGVIQAFIFALLTILYFQFSTGGGH